MAGDWIKMRSNLWHDPRIAGICDMTEASEATVIGALFWLWSAADQHTEDGVMPGLSLRQINRKTGVAGFGEALCAIGWIADHPEGVRIIKFEEHNGTSAKKRAETAKRVALHRASNAGSVTENAQKGTSALARERERERVREDKKGGDARASRLPTDVVLTDLWREFCKTERPDLDPASTFAMFRDYWTAKPGKEGNKLDWLATWRNWVRSQHQRPAPGAAQRATQRAAPGATQRPAPRAALLSFKEQDRQAGRKRWEEMTGEAHPDSDHSDHSEGSNDRTDVLDVCDVINVLPQALLRVIV
jgi:hypothetical protein